MASMSPSELLDWLGQAQLLTSTQINVLRPLVISFPDSHSLAKEMIRRHWLTPYQVNQILQGRHEQLLLGCYRLRERIGEGAMGQVFKAWNLKLERTVAVKTITKELINNDKAMERFRREVATASQLDHPNIAVVRDAGQEGGRPFLVMDFIEGIDLSQRVKQQGALAIHEAVEYARQTALGLQCAFEHGIVHRDIKPANLIVTTDGGRPLVKILDFGLARFEREDSESGIRLTQVGRTLGTIDYISPEQAQDSRNADIRADIYSLGCTLFYLLTAQPPFSGNDVIEKLGPRVTGEAPWIRGTRPEVPPGLEEVLRTMMARRPDDRYQTPHEAAQALMPYCEPTTGGIALATPVPAGMHVVEDVPMALPIASIAPEIAEPAFAGMTSTGRDLASGTSAATPRELKAKPFPVKLAVMVVGGALVFSTIACLGICLYFWYPTEPKRTGTLTITKAKFSMPDGLHEPGDRKRVLVWIERVNLKGAVKLSLLDLPPGVVGNFNVIPDNVKEGDVVFTVPFIIEPSTTPIRVRAECEAEGVSADFPLTLVIVQKRPPRGAN